jgi:ATP-dependent DNA helicase 2 subunit 1
VAMCMCLLRNHHDFFYPSIVWLVCLKTRRNEGKGQGADIKKNNFVQQPIGVISAPRIQELMQLVDGEFITSAAMFSLRSFFLWANGPMSFESAAREDPDYLRATFPPLEGARVPIGDVFTSCNWVLRDGYVPESFH